MLVLTRKPDERIICEVQPSDKVTTIELVLVRIELGQVRMGVEADKIQVNIIRSEIKPLLPVAEKPTTSIGQVSPDGLVNAINNAVASAIDECCDDNLPDPEYMLPMQKVAHYASEARRKKKNADYED